MALIRWRPFEMRSPYGALEELQDEVNRLFDVTFPRYGGASKIAHPAVDVHEDENNFYVDADLPGFEQKDIKVNYKDGALMICAARDEKKEEKKKNYHRIERFQGSFERIIPFVKKVDTGKIKARYEKGVLTVTLPKAPDEKTKEIAIDVS